MNKNLLETLLDILREDFDPLEDLTLPKEGSDPVRYGEVLRRRELLRIESWSLGEDLTKRIQSFLAFYRKLIDIPEPKVLMCRDCSSPVEIKGNIRCVSCLAVILLKEKAKTQKRNAPFNPMIKRKEFNTLVSKGTPDECWIWKGCIDRDGYGRFSLKTIGDKAHRAAFYFYHRRPPLKGMSICHKCDNPACVNPLHLFEGTHQDNVRDMWDKGRGRNQTTTPDTKKVGKEEVIAMRQKFKAGSSISSLALEYGRNTQAIKGIVTYKTWKHLP